MFDLRYLDYRVEYVGGGIFKNLFMSNHGSHDGQNSPFIFSNDPTIIHVYEIINSGLCTSDKTFLIC